MDHSLKIKVILYIALCFWLLFMFLCGYFIKSKITSHYELLGIIFGIISAMLSIGVLNFYNFIS